LVLGREKVVSVEGSFRRAVTGAGVLVVMRLFKRGMTDAVSVVRDGSSWSGSLVEVRRLRKEK
jgi:hypothetical protein